MLRQRSKESRQADYDLLTTLAYKCNRDELREAAIWIRNEMMKATRSDKNRIDDDGPTLPPMKKFLPEQFL